MTSNDEMWASVVARDKSADGRFYYSVASTGVFCRPSCPSRLANRENVRFHATCAEAEAAGFRACKRCKPTAPVADDAVYAARIAEACRIIDQSDTPPPLEDLARAVGVSPFHFHRVFKAAVGVTPKAYAVAKRQSRVRENLTRSRTVTEAVHDAGFNSNGRFYAGSGDVLGMTPTSFRAGGADAEIKFAVGECALGSILVAQSASGICAIFLGDDPAALVRDLEDRFPRATLIGADGAFEALVAAVVGFIETPQSAFDLPLDIRGTAFQHRVWDALRRIPPGTTISYADLAQRIGQPSAVRAVARACAANAIAVVIPCHRVVRTDGSISGYRWGVERKRALLKTEADG
ncbi:MAG: bifunctional DNA-binding transcriptional regulator/O6-methylguanine-DNA methyltransferase Ada [Hyphomicrobium sp.]